jgi:hypothetical protein
VFNADILVLSCHWFWQDLSWIPIGLANGFLSAKNSIPRATWRYMRKFGKNRDATPFPPDYFPESDLFGASGNIPPMRHSCQACPKKDRALLNSMKYNRNDLQAAIFALSFGQPLRSRTNYFEQIYMYGV